MTLSRILCTVSVLHQQPIHSYLVFYNAEETHAYKDKHTLNLEAGGDSRELLICYFNSSSAALKAHSLRRMKMG